MRLGSMYVVVAFAALGCGDDSAPVGGGPLLGVDGGVTVDARGSVDTPSVSSDSGPVMMMPTVPACRPASGGGTSRAAAPTLKRPLSNGTDEGWLGSPAIADLDGDGTREIIAARGAQIVVWRPDGTVRGSARVTGSRIWAAPVVGDFVGDKRLEIVAACRGSLAMLDAALQPATGFPVVWRDEIRSIAGGDIDGDGRLEIVVGTTSDLVANGQRDILTAFRGDGRMQAGFPPNTTGTSGCDGACYVHAGFDQNVAVGPIDGVRGDDIALPQDNAYVSFHQGSGVAFDANAIFRKRTKVLGVRFMLDYAEAQQGFANDETTGLQAHFTNSPATIVDLDGDGQSEIVMVSSVQNAAQTDRKRGVALWVVHRDGTRPPAWTAPFHVPAYLAGLEDLGNNIVGLTNSVAVADIDGAAPGLEMVFAGYDGKLHMVGTDRRERWTFTYTTAANVLTTGAAIADLSGDGVPEIVFATYSAERGRSALIVLDASGAERARVPLPGRGAMAVPTVADVEGDGALEILVSLKDGDATSGSVLMLTVPGSSSNCLPWPTGRGDLLRSGSVRR